MKKELEKVEKTEMSLFPSSSSSSVYAEELERQLEMVPFLPFLFFSGDKTPGVEPWKLVISENDEWRPVADGCMLVSIGLRNTIRRLVGKQYKDRAYEPASESHHNKSREVWEKNIEKAQNEEEGWQLGLTHLLYFETGESKIVTYESFGKAVRLGSLGVGVNPFLSQYLLRDTYEKGEGLILLKNDFSKCVRTSKKENEYLASYALEENFEEYFEITDIVKVKEKIKGYVEEKKEEVLNFLNK